MALPSCRDMTGSQVSLHIMQSTGLGHALLPTRDQPIQSFLLDNDNYCHVIGKNICKAKLFRCPIVPEALKSNS